MKLRQFLHLQNHSTNPQHNPEVLYNLYSLPAFDNGRSCEVVAGKHIQSNKFIVPDKCILFNKLNVRFKRIWVVDNQDSNKIASTEFLPLVVDESIVDFRYCYYLLCSDQITNYLVGQNTNTSGSHKRIDPKNFLDIEVELPSMVEQQTIGDVLATLDYKIALNSQINDNLEAMAKQLYDYWFVQFDFPDENGKPYKSSGGKMVWNEKLKREIPESWSVSYWGELVRANRGISYNTQSISGGGVPMINLASFNINGTYKHSGLKTYNGTYTEDKVLHALDLVMCNTQQTAIDFSKDIIAKAFLIPDIFEGEIVSSHHITTLQTDQEELKPYLSYLTNTYHFHKYAAGCCSGTNIMGLNYDGLKQYPMEVPDLNTLKAFMSIVYDVERRKGKLLLETEQLMSLRDEILPMLLNGQVSVNYHLYFLEWMSRMLVMIILYICMSEEKSLL